MMQSPHRRQQSTKKKTVKKSEEKNKLSQHNLCELTCHELQHTLHFVVLGLGRLHDCPFKK